MKNVKITYLFLILTLNLFSQKHNIDSAYYQLVNSKDSAQSIKLYRRLAKYNFFSNQVEKSIHYFNKGLEIGRAHV